MTGAKILDVILRVPDCDGQAADAASAYTQVKIEDAPRLLKIPQAGCPYIYKYVFTDMNVQNLGQTSKTRLFFLNEICTDTHSLVSCGKTVRGRPDGPWLGKSMELGMSVNSSKTWIILIGIRTSRKRTKNQTKAPTTHDSSDLVHVDHVPSNAKFSQSNAMLYVSEG